MIELDKGNQNCEPCSKEFNQTENDLYNNLIYWLELITCIPWVRANSISSTPENGQYSQFKDQYGIIKIQSVTNHTIERDGIIDIGEYEHCIRLRIESSLNVKLRVNNYSNTGFIKSPIDVLNHIYELHKIVYESNETLCNLGFSITDFGTITDVQKLENENTSISASEDLTITVIRYTSLAEKRIHDIKISLDCCQDSNNINNMEN